MKYVVVGLWAIGSLIGGLLSKSDEDVVLIGKEKQVRILNEKGLKINGFKNPIFVENINVSTDLSLIKNADIIFVCVKSQDTKNLAENIKKHLSKNSIIISFQNGVRNAQIIKEITLVKTLSSIIFFNAVYFKPGEVELTMDQGLIIENDETCSDKLKTVVEILNKEKLKAELVDEIDGFLWSKLIINLQNSVTSLTGQTIKESIIDKDSRKILIAVMKEGLEVLKQTEIVVKTLPDIDPEKLIRRMSMLNSTMLKIGSKIMNIKKNARSSMLQSISRGKPTEIDYINGEIVSLAKKNNLNAPVNAKIVELVKKMEKKQFERDFKPSELRKILKVG